MAELNTVLTESAAMYEVTPTLLKIPAYHGLEVHTVRRETLHLSAIILVYYQTIDMTSIDPSP